MTTFFTGNNKIILIFLSLLVAVSCIKDDRDNCPETTGGGDLYGLVLTFDYLEAPYPVHERTMPPTDRLSVFIYDESETYLRRVDKYDVDIDNYSLALDLKPGNYQIVVWAGLEEQLYDLYGLEPGVSSIGDSGLYLRRDSDGVVPNAPGVLYHGAIESTTVNNSGITYEHVILDRTTNEITINATGLNDDISYRWLVMDDNGHYSFDHGFIEDDVLTYLPTVHNSITGRATEETVEFWTMRLSQDRFNPVIQITDAATGDILWSHNLLELLFNVNPVINLDFEHIFEMTLKYNEAHILVSATINGWTVIFEEEDV